MIKELTFCKLFTAVDVITVCKITVTHRLAVVSIKKVWTLDVTILSNISLVTSFTNNIDGLINYNQEYYIPFNYCKYPIKRTYQYIYFAYDPTCTLHNILLCHLIYKKHIKRHDYVKQHIRTCNQNTLYTLTQKKNPDVQSNSYEHLKFYQQSNVYIPNSLHCNCVVIFMQD